MNYIRLLISIVMSFILLSFSSTMALANTNTSPSEKVIVVIMDYIDIEDLVNAYTPNLDHLVSKSGTGLMNIRAKNRYPSSSYMSLAVGYRVGTISNSEYSFNHDELVKSIPNVFEYTDSSLTAGEFYSLFTGITPAPGSVVNLYTANLKKHAKTYNPPFEIGQLGYMARTNGLKIAVLGNADTRTLINRNAAILAMDENGMVPLGNVSHDLSEENSLTLGGLHTNHQSFVNNFTRLLARADIIVADFGDTSRVEASRTNCSDELLVKYRRAAIERNDVLLGKIMDCLDLDHTMLAIITPNPNNEMVLENNFGLTPIIIYHPGQEPGYLSSATTRRSGLVSNSDFQPTLLGYLSSAQTSSIFTEVNQDNSLAGLNKKLTLFKQLRKSRTPLHYLFMFLALLTVILGYKYFISNRDKDDSLLKIVMYTTLSMPVVFLFLGFTGYTSVTGSILLSLFISLTAGGLAHLVIKNPAAIMALFTGITSVLLTVDCFRGSHLMLVSPLGSDAIAGGRFYGIGNDYMGILIASTVICINLILSRWNIKPIKRALIGSSALLLVGAVIGFPRYGANVGGFITSIVTAGVVFLILGDKRISWQKMTLIGTFAVLGVITVARLDALLSSAPSHAGKTINTLLIGGIPAFFSIIRTKLGILANTIYHSSWSVFLVISIILLAILWQKYRTSFLRVAVEQPAYSKSIRVLLVTALTVFIVNDTGVIASSLVVLYLICCLWLAAGETRNCNIEKGV